MVPIRPDRLSQRKAFCPAMARTRSKPMSPLAISSLVLACIFVCAVGGVFLRRRFPDEHLSAETKEVVKLVVGIVGTMTGMVLGLLVSSAKSSFDGEREGGI